MTFTTPIAAGVAAAIALPLLLLLYFLKLRRQPRSVGSTLLWRRTVEDLQVNTPFQRIRPSILLFFQLLALIAFILALGGPVVDAGPGGEERVIVLIDRSASMNAALEPDDPDAPDGSGVTRLERAKALAAETVARLARDGSVEVMVIAFADSAQVVSGYERHPARLAAAIDAIEPTDETADLGAALRLAEAFAAEDEAEGPAPRLVLFSDGGVGAAPPGGYAVRASDFDFVRVPEARVPAPVDAPAGPTPTPPVEPLEPLEPLEPVDNVGIVAFDVRRPYDDPASVEAFVGLASAGAEPVTRAVTLRADDAVLGVERVTVPPLSAPGDAPTPGAAAATFRAPLPGGAILTATLGEPDALAADDVAAAVLPPPGAPRLLVVSPGGRVDPYLEAMLDAIQPELARRVTPAEYAALEPASLAGEFDLVLFDRVSPASLPPIPSLAFGAAPPGYERAEPEEAAGRRILAWRREHPLLRDVALDDVVFAGFAGFVPATPRPPADDPDAAPADADADAGEPEPDRDSEPEPEAAPAPPPVDELALGPRGPVILALDRAGARHVFVGFDLGRSTWPIQPSILVFFQNVIDAATFGRTSTSGLWVRTGAVPTVRVEPGAEILRVEGPLDAAIRPGGRAAVTLPALRRAGLYRVHGALPPWEHVAVNLLSEAESDVRPRAAVRVNARDVLAARAEEAAPRELWPWFVALGLLALALEWLLYVARTRA